MSTEGLLTEVLITERGSNAAAVAAVDATEVMVADITDFTDYTADDTVDPSTSTTEGTGVLIDVLGERYTVASVTPGAADDATTEGAGETYDLAAELTPGILTLTEPLRAQVDEDDPVWVVLGTEVATDAYALVSFPQTAEVLGEGTDSGDVAHVPIPYGMRASYPAGVYDPPVPIVVADDLSAVLDTPGVKPVIDGSSIVNPPEPGPPTEAPASSPAVAVHGTVDSLVVEVVDEYAGTTTLDFHVSTEPDFTPTADTLAGSSRSAVFVIVSAPVTDAEGNTTSEPLALDTVYYVRTVARNVVGAAEPGPITPGVLDPSKVSEIVAARLVAGFILTGSIQAGNITINPETGITIPLSSGGVIHLPADGSPATIDAYIHARALNVDGDMSVNGYAEIGGDMMFAAGVTTPTQKATISWGWPSVEADFTSPGGRNWLVGPGSATGSVVSARYGSAGPRLNEIDPITGNLLRPEWTITMPPNYPEHPRTWASHDVEAYEETNDGIVLVTKGPPPGTIPPDEGSWGYHPETWLWLLDPTDFTVLGHRFLDFPGAEQESCTFMGDPVVIDLVDAGTSYGLQYSRYSWDSATSAFVQQGATVALPSWSTTSNHPELHVALFRSANQGEGGYYLAVYSEFVGGPIRVFERAALSTGAWARNTSRDMAVPNGMPPRNGLASVDLSQSGSLTQARLVANDINNRVHRLSTFNWVPRTVNARYTWYDGDPDGGTHESLPSPQVSSVIPPGQWPVITAPPAPHAQNTDPARVDKADRHGIYVSQGNDPVRLWGYLFQGTNGLPAGALDAGFDRTSTLSSDMGLPADGAVVPTVDGFIGTTADPAQAYSQATDADGSLWRLKGDGTWRLGALSGLASGAVNGAGRVQAGVSTYRATANGSAPGAVLGQEATPTVWSSSILRGFTYAAGAWTCQPGAGGTYLVWAKATWAGDTVNDWGCGLQVWKNGAQMGGINDIRLHSKVLGNSTGPVLVAPIEIAVGDQMAMSIWQASGSAKTPNGVQFYLVPLLS